MMKKLFYIFMFGTVVLFGNTATLYTKCAACHGNYGQDRALGKSEAIQGKSASGLYQKLKSYAQGKENAYGYGSLMKMQVVSLSDSELQALAKYISRL